jgi:hypothetical protein
MYPRHRRTARDDIEMEKTRWVASSTSGTRSVLKVAVGTVAAAGDAEDHTSTAPMLTNDHIDDGAENAVGTRSHPADGSSSDPLTRSSPRHRGAFKVALNVFVVEEQALAAGGA